MKDIFKKAYVSYVNHMVSNVDEYGNSFRHQTRKSQCESVIDSINERFNFDRIITLETGASQSYNDGLFGLFLGFASMYTNGNMYSVDINEEYVNRSITKFNESIPNLNYSAHVGDSVSYLKNIKEIPNLVHLDSWDFNLFDPFPSALHGWREFEAIQDKMESGSIIIIDDNWRKDTLLQWVFGNGESTDVSIKYPMIGKGAHIYQQAIENTIDWKLVGNHYDSHDCIKIIIQKN
jgi:hypothetical protein